MKKIETTSFSLHILAMFCMLLDHLWATVVPGNLWMTCVGRIAYPIFAFLLVEGYFHTRNLNRYLIRLLIFALISEIPFNLMMGGGMIYPFHQNVLWTFLIGLLAIRWMEKVRTKDRKPLLTWLAVAGIAVLAALVGLFTFVDYNAGGVLMVLVFYLFRGRKWYHYLGQLAGMYWINFLILTGQDLAFTLMGREFFFPVQGFAVLALLPIWLYHGSQGYHRKWVKWCFYGFYPVHILILWAIQAFR